MKKIAFYAPIKPPDHPIPSGDRLIARNLISALTIAGFEVELVSRFIAYSKREAEEILIQRKSNALVEAQKIIASLKNSPPDIWITYHPYCKAPDWLGPLVSKALSIPYVTIEAVRTGQGFEDGGDRWAKWRAEAQAGIRSASLHLAFKSTDRAYLTELLGTDNTIKDIPPFIDTTPPINLPSPSRPANWNPITPVLVTTGMMRPGKKVKNFEILAEALTPLQDLDWNLTLIGGGPEEPAVKKFFAHFDQSRLNFTGAIPHDEVLAHMETADIFTWPGWKEPIGMVYLEAQMMGLPVAALNSMGVPLTVYHERTGLLAEENNMLHFTVNLETLITDKSRRQQLGAAAHESVNRHHSLIAASSQLKEILNNLLASN
ncbi:MAG: glycosyltransferase family 4 protein [Rhizobiaceae bacterium]